MVKYYEVIAGILGWGTNEVDKARANEWQRNDCREAKRQSELRRESRSEYDANRALAVGK